MKDWIGKNNVLFILRASWGIKKSLFFYFALNIMLTLTFSLAAIIAPRELISSLVNNEGYAAIWRIALIFLAVSGVSGFLVAYIKGFYIANLQEIRMKHLHDMQTKTLKLDYGIYEDESTLNKMWLVRSLVIDFRMGIQGVLMRLFQISANIVVVSFYFGLIFQLSPWVVLFLAANMMIVFISSFYSYRYNTKVDEERAPLDRKSWYLNNRVFNDFGFGKDIRIYGISNWILDLYRKNFMKQNEFARKIETRNYQVSLLSVAISFVRDIIVYGALINGVIDGRINIADFTMLFLAVAAFSLLVQEISTDIAFVRSQDERFEAYRNFMSLPDEEARSGGASIPPPKANGYEIEFKDISFKYPNSDKYIYENFNLKIADGEKLAIVGLNGAGKTTLIKLLLRFYDPEAGEILLNGIDIKTLDLLAYRKNISAVFQEITLIATSLVENLTLSRCGYDANMLDNAMKLSGFYDKFKTFERGGETQVLKNLHPDGVDFSGGEIQKIAITRALYKNGSIMILDEPTAALDAIAEYELYNGLAKISKGKTVVFVSHRLASTRFCDRIALVGNGGIIEIGSHDGLIALKGMYHDMFETQAKAYREDGDKV